MATSVLSAVPQARYLLPEVDPHYRVIIRLFYTEHQAHRRYLTSTDIYRHLKQTYYPDYSETLCQYHLDMLEGWQCIRPLPEQVRPRSRAELRYKPRTYQAERFTLQLEEVRAQSDEAARLSPNALDDLAERLDRLSNRLVALILPTTPQQRQEIHRTWHSAFDAYESFRRSTEDYLADLMRNQPKTSIDFAAFEAYRERIVRFLSEYIQRLYDHKGHIRFLLGQIAGAAGLLTRLCAEQQSTDVSSRYDQLSDTDALEEGYRTAFGKLCRYFAESGDSARPSDMDILIDQANQWIVEITSHASRLSEAGKTAYEQLLLKLASDFADLDGLAAGGLQAAELAQVIFSATLPLHWRGEAPPAPPGPAWEEPAQEVSLYTVRRGRSQRVRPDRTQDQSDAYLQQMLERAEQRRRQAADLDALFGPSAVIETTSLKVASPQQRRILRTLLQRALATGGTATVGYRNWSVKVAPLTDTHTGVLSAPDGRLYHVPYRMELIKGGGL